jgi:hypothetical protein
VPDRSSQTVLQLWDAGDLRHVYAATPEGRSTAEADARKLRNRNRADWESGAARRPSVAARGYREPTIRILETAVLSQRREAIWGSMLAEALAETGGPLTDAETAWADHSLGRDQEDG